jgi:arabinose-5-phosphate isomerase
MLALGDALAIATMAARGVTNAHLRQLHPGGSIGLSLVTVADIMHHGDAMPLVPLAMPMREVLLEMTEKSLGIAGVVDRAGHLVGAISDGDLRRHVHGLLTACAEDVMTRTPRTVRADARAGEALAIMSQEKVSALFVVEGAIRPADRGAAPARPGPAGAELMDRPLCHPTLHRLLDLPWRSPGRSGAR